MSSGYVYVLSNPSMPGLVKIGRSINGGRSRAKDLYAQATGVPMPFKLEFEIWSEDHEHLEIEVHNYLQDRRISDSREFFKASITEAKIALMAAYGDHIDCSVAEMRYVVDVQSVDYLLFKLKDIGYQSSHKEIVNALEMIDAGVLMDQIEKLRLEKKKEVVVTYYKKEGENQ